MPPSLDTKARFPETLVMANFEHVASHETEVQAGRSLMAAMTSQLSPLSEERYMPPPATVATITVPLSAIDTEDHFLALPRGVQVDPESVET